MHSQSPIEAEWQLLAIVQIKRLEAACSRRLDGKPWDQLAQLFTPDYEFTPTGILTTSIRSGAAVAMRSYPRFGELLARR
jgi:hypothetical protein